jgi:transcriptional regulator with XRE-family HTH domain
MDVSTPTNNQESNSGLLFVGQQLSERRLAKGLSQEQLADRMHLGIEQLAALESGDRDKLPELVFIKAMVRRLSTHLELDADALVSSLGSLSDSGGAKERVTPAKGAISLPPQPSSRPESEAIWTWLVLIGACSSRGTGVGPTAGAPCAHPAAPIQFSHRPRQDSDHLATEPHDCAQRCSYFIKHQRRGTPQLRSDHAQQQRAQLDRTPPSGNNRV